MIALPTLPKNISQSNQTIITELDCGVQGTGSSGDSVSNPKVMFSANLGELFDSDPEARPKREKATSSKNRPENADGIPLQKESRRRRRKKDRMDQELQQQISRDRHLIKLQRNSDVKGVNIPDFLLADAEDEEGSCEYKWRLIKLTDARFQELVTQMKYRLAEGDGECRYEVGLEDNGLARGLDEDELNESIGNVRRMAASLGAKCEVVSYLDGIRGRCASLVVTKLAHKQKEISRVPDARIAMLGSVDSGKSTLLAVIASNRLDDANGTRRSTVFRYPHEVVSGCTSAISRHLVGFDEDGLPVSLINRGDVSVPSVQDEEEVLNAKSLLQFVDLPGSRKYLRTTFRGLLSTGADFLILCVDAANFLCGPEDEDIWNLKLAAAMKWPAAITLTYSDLMEPEELFIAKSRAEEWQNKIVGPHGNGCAPVVCVSSVTGKGLDELRAILAEVGTQQPSPPQSAGGARFLVQDIWPRQDEDLPVVGGTIIGGSMRVGMKVCVGSVNARVHSIQVLRKNVQQVDKPGLACTMALETFGSKISRAEESEASTCSDSETERPPAFRVGDLVWELGCRPAFPQEISIKMSPIFGREELLQCTEGAHRRLLLHAHGARCEIEVVRNKEDLYQCRFSWGREFLEPGMPVAVTSALSSEHGAVMAVGYIVDCPH